MSRELSILKNYLLYFLLMILVCMVGISNVMAWDWTNSNGITYTAVGYITDKTDVLIDVAYETQAGGPLTLNSQQVVYTEIKTFYANISNYNFSANTRYEIEFNLPNMTFNNNANMYSVSGLNGEQCLISLSDSDFTSAYPRFDFQCPSATNYVSLSIYNSNGNSITNKDNFSWYYSHLYSSTMQINSSTTNNNDLIINANQNADRIIDNQNQNTQDIIDNQNSNNQAIINNNNQNTQNIIDNQNANNQAILDDNKKNFQSCRDSYNLFNITSFKDSTNRGIDWTLSNDKISISSIGTLSSTYTSSGFNNLSLSSGSYKYYVFDTNIKVGLWLYNSNATLIKTLMPNQTFTINENVVYYQFYFEGTNNTNYNFTFRPAITLSTNLLTDFEPYGEEICTNKLDEQTNAINGLNDSLNDDDSSGATSEASEFFNSFTTNTFGLTSIITAPLNLIQSLTSSTCTELHLPLPYLNNKYLDLPCMTTIYQTHFGAFFTMYQTITYGIIAYWVIVRIFNQVKDFKNPEHDEIEVVDL